MADVWRHVELSGLPSCDGETVFVGINSAGFACCFNEVTKDGVCSMVGPELTTTQMSCLRWWRMLDRPAILGAPVIAVPQPYAYEFGRSNGDGTYSVVIERGSMVNLGPNQWGYGPPKDPHPDHPVKPLYEHPRGMPGTSNDQQEQR